MIVITVLDRVSSKYSDPYTFINLDDCKRRLAVAYKGNPFVNDLEVYELGFFDNLQGCLSAHDKSFMFTMSALIKEVFENA